MVRRKLLVILIGVIVLGVMSQFESIDRLKNQAEVNERELVCIEAILSQYVQPRDKSVEMLQWVTPAVVRVMVRLDNKRTRFGSGVCIDNGLILTCAHLFRSEPNFSDVKIRFPDKKEFISTGYAVSKDINDVAVIIFDPNGYEHRWINIQRDAPVPVKVGQTVFSIGCPKGLDFSVSRGIVSKEETLVYGKMVIQVDSALNHGNSGGPTFNEWGNLLGIGSFIYSDFVGGGNIGLGFIVPTRVILETIPDLINQVKEGK
jgi:S1-C subfamily serine protease